MSKNRNMVYTGVFLVVVLVAWTAFSLLPGPKSAQFSRDGAGICDLTGYDFQQTVYVTTLIWDSWPEKLYAPEQLQGAPPPVSQRSLDYETVQYATYRLRLQLPPGGEYGLSMRSAPYAMRIFIDGAEAGSVGRPAAAKEETIAQERGVAYYFTPEGAVTEIVVQVANFVHRRGGEPPAFTVGTAENIWELDSFNKVKEGVVFGCLLTAGLYHMAVFLLNRKQTATLVFSLECLLLGWAKGNSIALFFPVDWQVSVRMEYVTFLLAVAVLVLLVNALFPRTLHRWVITAYWILCGVYTVMVLAADTLFFTIFTIPFQAASIALAAYGIIRLAMHMRGNEIKTLLAFVGVASVAVFSVLDVLSRYGIYLLGYVSRYPMGASEGMVFFIFCYALLISIEQAETNKRLEDAKLLAVQNRQAKESYEQIKTHLNQLGSLKHEIKNHFAALRLYLKDGQYAEAETYLTQYAEQVIPVADTVYPDNFLLNAVAGSLLQRAGESGIKVDLNLKAAPNHIAGHDFYSLLSNILDNALEACGALPDGAERFIRLSLTRREPYLNIRCENSRAGEIACEDGEIRTSKAGSGHGYGLQTITRIVDAYDGLMNVDYDESTFTIMAALKDQ